MNLTPLVIIFANIIAFVNAVLVPLVFSIAFIVFLWGIFQYFIAGAADEEKRTQGRNFVMWSVIGFAVMFSLWGIVNLLIGSFGFRNGVTPPLPTLDVGTSGASPNSAYTAPTTFPSGQGTYQTGWVCTDNSQCVSGRCELYTAEQGSDGSDPGQKRCL